MIHVDTNVIIDVLTNRVGFVESAIAALARIQAAPAAIGPMVYAELAGGYADRAALDEALLPFGLARLHMDDDALFLAARTYRSYLARGGTRTSILPDFFIGAHAFSTGARLLTRDPRRYRTAFPELDIVEP